MKWKSRSDLKDPSPDSVRSRAPDPSFWRETEYDCSSASHAHLCSSCSCVQNHPQNAQDKLYPHDFKGWIWLPVIHLWNEAIPVQLLWNLAGFYHEAGLFFLLLNSLSQISWNLITECFWLKPDNVLWKPGSKMARLDSSEGLGKRKMTDSFLKSNQDHFLYMEQRLQPRQANILD